MHRFPLVSVSGGHCLVVVRELLFVVASLVGRAQALGCVGFDTWGTWACRLYSAGHRLSGPEARGVFLEQGVNPMSPALAGRFLTTEPPGKSPASVFSNSFPGCVKCLGSAGHVAGEPRAGTGNRPGRHGIQVLPSASGTRCSV